MTKSKSDLEELNKLQREAAELRAERKRSRSTAKGAEEKPSESTDDRNTATTPPMQDSVDDAQGAASDKVIEDFADQIESIAKKLEEAAIERPALALLAAFSLGIIVGQIFSRR